MSRNLVLSTSLSSGIDLLNLPTSEPDTSLVSTQPIQSAQSGQPSNSNRYWPDLETLYGALEQETRRLSQLVPGIHFPTCSERDYQRCTKRGWGYFSWERTRYGYTRKVADVRFSWRSEGWVIKKAAVIHGALFPTNERYVSAWAGPFSPCDVNRSISWALTETSAQYQNHLWLWEPF